MTAGEHVTWKHRDVQTQRVGKDTPTQQIGTVKRIDGVHVLVLWAGQPQPFWTVEWQLARRDFGTETMR